MALDFNELEALFQSLAGKRKGPDDYEDEVRRYFSDRGLADELTEAWAVRICGLLAKHDHYGLTPEEARQYEVLAPFDIVANPVAEEVPTAIRPAEETPVPLAAEEPETAEAADALPAD